MTKAGPGPAPQAVMPQLVIVGAAARDVDRADPRGWRLGGSVTYGALVAARLGARVGALVGVDDAAAADGHELELLRAAGADVRLVPLGRGPVFDNVHTPHGRQQIGHAASDPVSPDALPAAWGACAAFLLAPVGGEIRDDWVDAIPPDRLVGLGWQGLLRAIEPGEPVGHLRAEPRPLFARSDAGCVSSEDLRAGGDRLDRLLPRPGQELVLTADERGGLHVVRTAGGFRMRYLPAIEARQVRDPTGAGDAFHTTWFLGRLRDGPFGASPLATGRALHLAAVVASLAVETVGLAGVPDRLAVARRIAELMPPAAPTAADRLSAQGASIG